MTNIKWPQHRFKKWSRKLCRRTTLMLILLVFLLQLHQQQERSLTKEKLRGSERMIEPAKCDPMPPFPRMPNTMKEAMDLMLSYRRNERVTFIQIGAHDSKMFVPLYEAYDSKLEHLFIGLQVEPTPVLFDQLKTLHRNASGWAFYNGAIAGSDVCINGTVTFLDSPKSGGNKFWYYQGQTSTLSLKTEHRSVFEPAKWSCVTNFDDLLNGYATPEFVQRTLTRTKSFAFAFHVDFLQINVKGYTDKVIQLINWETLSPQCIHFENVDINATLVNALLETRGYYLQTNVMDTLACRVFVPP